MKLPCATLAALLLWGSDNATAAVAEVNSSNASFGKNGNSLSNVSREYWHVVSQAQAKDCRVTGNGTKTECKFNAQALLLTENATIQVTVKTNGLQVNCSAINVTHSNEWYVSRTNKHCTVKS